MTQISIAKNITSNINNDTNVLSESAIQFATIAQKTLNGMAGAEAVISSQYTENQRIKTDKDVFVSTFFTGIVYGEFILAMSRETAGKLASVADGSADDPTQVSMSTEHIAALCEMLNIISGQSLTYLGKYYDKLTLTSPRVYFGKLFYPNYPTGMLPLSTKFGEIECYFYLDRMQLDLAVSYKEAMESLITTNKALISANNSLKKQQAQLVHSEKMASLGMMAAGVAHEINNPLAYVDSNISTLEEYSGAIQSLLKTHELLLDSLMKHDRSHLKESLDEIRRLKKEEDYNHVLSETQDIFSETKSGIKRIKDIIIGLKKFSHIDQGEIKEVNLNDEIENMLRLVSNQIRYRCEVIKEFESIPMVTCYPGQLNQVFVNLLVNAAQAMPEKGGLIRISSKAVTDGVAIRFADNGCGIAAENISKIFDPFFSTKPVGEGTGLGLSISYGIIEKHGGRISVESEIGKGTVFTIYLPLTIATTQSAESK